MDRRSFLARTSIAAGLAGLAGCGGDAGTEHMDRPETQMPETSTPTPEPGTPEDPLPDIPDGFDRLVDVVEEGADPTGEQSIVPVLDGIDPDGTLVYFPPGRYRMDGSWNPEEFERVGVVGRDATVVPDPNTEVYLFSLDGRERCIDLRIEGLSFDYSDPDATGRMLHLKSRDGLFVGDVTATGTVKSRPSLVRVDVTEPDGEGLVERLELTDGGLPGTSITGCYVGNNSRGDITFRDCRIEGFPDNGLYADPPAGSITVEGGYFANCGISNVRVRGDSVVRDVYVRCDDAHREFDNMRGIRLTDYEPQYEPEPGVVENCRVDMLDVTHSDGAIELSGQLARGVVRDCHVRVDADDVPAFRAKSPDPIFEELGIGPTVTLDGFTVEGSASDGEAIRIVGRHDCTLSGIDIHQTGLNRAGIVFQNSVGNVIRGARIDVSGLAISLDDSDAETTNVDIVDTIDQGWHDE